MSWLSDIWSSITGGGNNQAAQQANQQQQQNFQLQQQIYENQALEAARQREKMTVDEAKRQEYMRTGTSAIDNAFSQFNEPFFQNAQNKYANAHLPQVDEEAGRTKDKLIASLFDRGMLESSVGAGALGDLEKKRLDTRAQIGNEAADFAGGIRKQVDTQKNALYDVARSAVDPSAVASRATGEAATLSQAPGGYQYAPSSTNLGDVFGSVLEPFAYGLNAYQNRTPSGYRPSGGSVGSSALKIFG